MTVRSAILLLNHFRDEQLVALYTDIARECGDEHDVFLLSDRTRVLSSFARLPPGARQRRFTFDDLLALGYRDARRMSGEEEGRNLKCGNMDLPVLYFQRRHPGYAHYWVVEYDVRFSGRWGEFFSAFDGSDADLLGTTLMRYPEFSDWDHWDSLSVPWLDLADDERLRSFLPVYRISADALECLHEAYGREHVGHYEALIPTILNKQGLRLEDIGGTGEFVRPGNENRFYTNTRLSNPLSPGTFVFRPLLTDVGELPDKLWHPVKPASTPMVP
jgi:hypothetical protein